MQVKKKLRKASRWALVSAAAVALLAGCTGTPGTTAPSTPATSGGGSSAEGDLPRLPEGTKIGLAMREIVNGFNRDIIAGVEAMAEKAGATVTVTDAGGDQTKQITQIRSLINSGVDGIVVGLGTADALAPVIKEATDKGIVVTSAAVGATIPGALADVSGNEFLVGSLSGAMLLQYIDFSGEVYALSVPGAPVLDARLNAVEGMALTYPDVTINVVPTEHSASKVYSQVQSLLAAHPDDDDIKAIWVAYDQLSTGAVQAVQQANRNIPVFSVDGGVEGFQMLAAPASPFVSTVADQSSVMGEYAGRYLILGLAGKTEGIPAASFGPTFAVSRNNFVEAAELQLGATAWEQLGTTADEIAKLFPQNQPVWPVTPLVVTPAS